jgi:hypothetical protein
MMFPTHPVLSSVNTYPSLHGVSSTLNDAGATLCRDQLLREVTSRR